MSTKTEQQIQDVAGLAYAEAVIFCETHSLPYAAIRVRSWFVAYGSDDGSQIRWSIGDEFNGRTWQDRPPSPLTMNSARWADAFVEVPQDEIPEGLAIESRNGDHYRVPVAVVTHTPSGMAMTQGTAPLRSPEAIALLDDWMRSGMVSYPIPEFCTEIHNRSMSTHLFLGSAANKHAYQCRLEPGSSLSGTRGSILGCNLMFREKSAPPARVTLTARSAQGRFPETQLTAEF